MIRFAYVSFLLFTSGCYLSHQRPDAPDAASLRDARVDAGADASTPIDAHVPAFTCRMQRQGDAVARAPTTHQAQAPDVYWDGRQVGVAMMEGGGDLGHPEVTLARIAPDLSTVDAPIRVGDNAHGWGEVDLAGDRLALCYHGDPGGTGRTMFRTVGLDGSLGPRSDIDEDGEACLDLVAAEGVVFLGWRHRAETPEGYEMETWLAPIGLDGALRATPTVLARGPYPGATVNLAADGPDVVAAIGRDDAVRVVRMNAGGVVSAEREIDLPGAVAASVAIGPEGETAVAMMSGPRETRSLWFLRLDRDFVPLMEPRRISDGAPSAVSARVERAPDGWWVSWATSSRPSTRAMLLHLDEDGQALEPRFTIFDGLNSGYGGPQMARVERDLYVGLSQNDDSSAAVHVQRWTCVEDDRDPCAPQDAIDVGCDESGEPPLWRWTGDACALVSCPSACSGPDCADLAPSRFGCESDHALCPREESCEGDVVPLSITRACVPREALRVDEAMFVSASVDVECPCDLALECHARVSAPFELELDTRGCQGTDECEDCDPGTFETLRVRCELPPLGVGTWSIRHGDEVRLDLEVIPRWEEPTGLETCSD